VETIRGTLGWRALTRGPRRLQRVDVTGDDLGAEDGAVALTGDGGGAEKMVFAHQHMLTTIGRTGGNPGGMLITA
jgi:hypothetical protein